MSASFLINLSHSRKANTALLAIAALLSEDNRWVNAQRIEISGGQSI
ncbi:hypothetical protein LC653_33890 [Nostoc sp. CHAB 5784]|nr:hypothetical protein [Nostoc mirabile]MCC5668710.1 hypothetical protein [Nostoc mirabile CHAB5784]